MAQVQIIHPSELGAVYVLEETTFGQWSATGTRAYPVAGTLEFTTVQAENEVKPLAVDPHGVADPVAGLKSGTAKFTYYLQPSTEVLSASVGGTATETPLDVLMRAIFGAPTALASVVGGTTVASGGSTSGCTVQTGKGANFLPGQIALVKDPNGGLLPTRITTRSTDTLTWYPRMTGAMVNDAAVYNTFTWYPSRTNTKSLSVAIATGQDSNYQWLLSGGTGSVTIKVDRNSLATAEFDMQFSSWTGPTAYSLSVATSADSMGAPFSSRNAICILQATNVTTRITYPIESATIKFNLGNKLIESLAGGTENVTGVGRVENVTDAGCEAEVTFAADTTPDATWWGQGTVGTARTSLHFMLGVPYGASGSERWLVVGMPLCKVVGKPKYTKSGSLTKCTITLRGYRDTACTGSTTDMATAPGYIAIG